MAGCRRLSFCACPDNFPGSVSARLRSIQGRARTRGRWTGTRRWRRWREWRRKRGAASPIRDAPACRRCSEGSDSAKARATKAGRSSNAAGCSPAREAAECGGHGARSGCGCRDERRTRGRTRNGWRDWIGGRHRHWKLGWPRHRRWTCGSVSAHADAVFPAAATRSGKREGVSPDRVVRRRREGKSDAAGIQSLEGRRIQSQAARRSHVAAVSARSSS